MPADSEIKKKIIYFIIRIKGVSADYIKLYLSYKNDKKPGIKTINEFLKFIL